MPIKEILLIIFQKKDSEILEFDYIKEYVSGNSYKATEPLFHKSANYSYEDEWRIIKIAVHSDRRLWKINPESIRRIIFGSATVESDKKRIKEEAASLGHGHISFAQVIPDTTTGKLKMIEV